MKADGRNAAATWLRVSFDGRSLWVLAGDAMCDKPIRNLSPVTAPSTKKLSPRAPESGPPPKALERSTETYSPEQWVIEYDIDRERGPELRHFDLSAPMPALCRQACKDEPRCQAYVYAEPGLRSEWAHCWLKEAAPLAVPRAGFISGVRTYGLWEEGIDRVGGDLPGKVGPVRSAQECLNWCRSTPGCGALTYERSNQAGATTLCWLKGEALAGRQDPKYISAVLVYGKPQTLAQVDTNLADQCTGNLAFRDDFSRRLDARWDAEPAWQVSSDVLRGHDHFWATVRGPGWRDFVFSARVVLDRGTLHVNLRRQGRDRYYLGMQEGHLYLKKTRGNASDQQLAVVDVPLRPGQWRLLQVSVRGGRIEVFLDGVEVLDVTDPQPLGPGTIAFETLKDAVARLDYVQVCTP